MYSHLIGNKSSVGKHFLPVSTGDSFYQGNISLSGIIISNRLLSVMLYDPLKEDPPLNNNICVTCNILSVFSVPLVCKEELNLMLKVIGLLVKVRWV